MHNKMKYFCFFIVYLHHALFGNKERARKENNAAILIYYNAILPLILFHFLQGLCSIASPVLLCRWVRNSYPFCLFVALFFFCSGIWFVQMKNKMVFTCFFIMLLYYALVGIYLRRSRKKKVSLLWSMQQFDYSFPFHFPITMPSPLQFSFPFFSILVGHCLSGSSLSIGSWFSASFVCCL